MSQFIPASSSAAAWDTSQQSTTDPSAIEAAIIAEPSISNEFASTMNIQPRQSEDNRSVYWSAKSYIANSTLSRSLVSGSTDKRSQEGATWRWAFSKTLNSGFGSGRGVREGREHGGLLPRNMGVGRIGKRPIPVPEGLLRALGVAVVVEEDDPIASLERTIAYARTRQQALEYARDALECEKSEKRRALDELRTKLDQSEQWKEGNPVEKERRIGGAVVTAGVEAGYYTLGLRITEVDLEISRQMEIAEKAESELKKLNEQEGSLIVD